MSGTAGRSARTSRPSCHCPGIGTLNCGDCRWPLFQRPFGTVCGAVERANREKACEGRAWGTWCEGLVDSTAWLDGSARHCVGPREGQDRRNRRRVRRPPQRRRRIVEGPVSFPRREDAVVPRHAGSRMYFCFGCNQGGDVIRFVERSSSCPSPRRSSGSRSRSVYSCVMRSTGRLHLNHIVSSEPGWSRHIGQPPLLCRAAGGIGGGGAGRRFLDERGFDRDAAVRFGVGYAPRAVMPCASICVRADSATTSW